MAVLDGMEALIIARACKRKIDVAIGSGSRLPLGKTALGHVLLAALPPAKLTTFLQAPTFAGETAAEKEALLGRLKMVKTQHYANIRGLLDQRLVAVAVPIRDRSGRVVAALNVTSYTTPPSQIVINNKFLRPLSETGSQIEAVLRSSDATIASHELEAI